MTEPILALEGALGGFSVALLSNGRLNVKSTGAHDALERGLVLVDAILREEGLKPAGLGGLAVGTGPGGFTGLRIAIAFAKSLALGSGLPLVGVSSFDIVDEGAAAAGRVPRLTVVEGRRGVVCIRRSDRTGERIACGLLEPTVERVLDGDREIALVGATEDVCGVVGKRAKSVHILSAGPEPPAATLARIARTRDAAASAHAIAPDYGELPAARER
ncbi:MAG: tRNA (adenosine(37)-N6)-threonylcarbamoyltransferase complex dimerization subunit type 1 TsaB [Candidatus Eremiobacteraeota bacterium]|nr:tRNA (adenosine(37)-N6)-threonylcarbamoyltransferase complex dimerization subunit type 1 TsaB [Candidatus Eremiobacteraeota bacterium]